MASSRSVRMPTSYLLSSSLDGGSSSRQCGYSFGDSFMCERLPPLRLGAASTCRCLSTSLSASLCPQVQPACSFCFRPQPTPRRSLSMTHDPCSRWPQHNPCPPTRFVTASINLAREVFHLVVPGANRGLLFSGLVLAAVQPRQVHVPYGVDPSKLPIF